MLKTGVPINYANAGSEIIRREKTGIDILEDALAIVHCGQRAALAGGQIKGFGETEPLEYDLSIFAPIPGLWSVTIYYTVKNTVASPSWPTQWVARLDGEDPDEVYIDGPYINLWYVFARFDNVELSGKNTTLELLIDPDTVGFGDPAYASLDPGPVRLQGKVFPSAMGINGPISIIDGDIINNYNGIDGTLYPYISNWSPIPE